MFFEQVFPFSFKNMAFERSQAESTLQYSSILRGLADQNVHLI